MNPVGSENMENELTPPTIPVSPLPKRTYTKREKKVPTIASLNEEIEAKNREIEAIQVEIKRLMAKRNELYIHESVDMGLMDIIADPEKARSLARFIEESNKI